MGECTDFQEALEKLFVAPYTLEQEGLGKFLKIPRQLARGKTK
jgi:hypothetical protein